VTKVRFVIPLLIGLPLLTYLWTLYQTDENAPKVKTALQKTGDECASIAENAVANMNAVVAFQMLEKEGRKINVMRRCMADRAYMENPKWLAYGAPIAKADALKQGISEDEAIENLRRVSMMDFAVSDQQPIYWTTKP
jgi:ABC-type multidrug transport system fused ATPase/permease subunit